MGYTQIMKRKTVFIRICTVSLFLCAAAFTAQQHHERNLYSSVSFFYIEEIEREHGEIEIKFNIPADPASVSPDCFIIDDEPLAAQAGDIPIKFSRRGDKIVIKELPQWRHRVISIRLTGIRTLNGTLLEEIPPVYIDEDQEYEREDDLEYVYWYWYDTHGGQSFSE